MDDGRWTSGPPYLVPRLSSGFLSVLALTLCHFVPHFEPLALCVSHRSGPRRQIDLSADYSSISEQGPARKQLKTILSRVREDDALEVHR